jgi:cysteine desulfurase
MATAAAPGLGQPLSHLDACIYLDYNATTPIFPEVSDAMLPFVTTHFGNPSSGHVYGAACRRAVDGARASVAALIGAASPSEICFVGCGTEADNWAIWGTTMAARARLPSRRPHVVASVVEHPAVLEFLSAMQLQGLLRYTLVPVGADGAVDPEAFAAAVEPDTCLATLMHSNNELGTLQPVAAAAAAVRRRAAEIVIESDGPIGDKCSVKSVLFHTDAAQSLGKVQVDVTDLGVDLLTVVGHKFGAPKGVGALYVRKGVYIERLLAGGGQEGGRRAGTESVLLLSGLGAAADVAASELPEAAAHMAAMRDRLLCALRSSPSSPWAEATVNGPEDPAGRLPNTLSITLRGFKAAEALAQLSHGLAASAGAACHTGGAAMSHVLAATGLSAEEAAGTLRLSTGRHTTAAEVDAAALVLIKEARRQLMGGSA